LESETIVVNALDEAVGLLKADRLAEASARFSQMHTANPTDARPLHYLGIVALKERDFHRAVSMIEKALRLRPNVAEFHHNLAAAYRVLGRLKDAEHHYRLALQLMPDYAEAYFNLSGVRRFSAGDPEPDKVAQLLSRDGVSESDRCFLHFAAGKMHDDMGNYDLAFDHYRKGNATRNVTFDRKAHGVYVDKTIQVFDRQRVRLRSGEPRAELPIFIVGMPRSGTTLVEQILASHPDVFGAGEIPDITSIAGTMPQHAASGALHPDCAAELGIDVFRGFGEAYLRRLITLDGQARRIVNKTPMNFEFLGLITMLLPSPRVIHCRRDPLDTCLSCYFQRFRGGQEYSYSVENLGFYYRMYERLMQHWREVLPMEMLEIDYETLVSKPEETAKAMIEFCGLPWDSRCLEFHRSKRPVTTASNWQVRQPLYTSAVRRSDRYANHLASLRAALTADVS
jgi:tetratricopeptide (TPR) repeat protein